MKIAPVNQTNTSQPYGTMPNVTSAAQMPAHIHPGTAPAPPSGNKYEGKQGVCVHIDPKTGDGCRGPRAQQTDFCIGHLRAIEKFIKATKKQESSANTEAEDKE